MVAEEGFTAAEEAGFMEVAEEGFTAVEVSTAEATLVSAADTPSAGIVAAASTVVAAATAGAAGATAGAAGATAGAADIGAIEDTVMDGDGDLARVAVLRLGREIRMAMATARGITRPTLIILTRTTILQTIRRAIRIRDDGNDDPPLADPNARPQPNQNGPARSWRSPVPGGAANANYANSNVAAATPRGPVLSVDRMSVTPSSDRAARSILERSPPHMEQATPQADTPLRPEMQKALQRLREMPPYARQREIDFGRYSNFSAEERELLRKLRLTTADSSPLTITHLSR